MLISFIKYYSINIKLIGSHCIKYGMLLEHNDYHHYLRYRITSSHNLHHNEYRRDHLKGITMNKPSASKYKLNTELDTAETKSLQEQYQQHQQQQQLMLNQQVMQHSAAAAALTSPLQHLNNIFGLNMPNNAATTTAAATATHLPLAATHLFQANNLQHLLAGVTAQQQQHQQQQQQQQQQFQQLYNEFYGSMLPQHYFDNNKMLRSFMASANVNANAIHINTKDTYPIINAGLNVDKLIDCRLPQTELSHKETKTLTPTSTTDMNFVFSCNQAGKVSSAVTPSSSASLSAVLSDFVSSLNHVNSSSSSSDAGNIASLDHQHNETTHANQIRNNNNIPSNEHSRIQTSTSLSTTTTTSNNLVDTKSMFSVSNVQMTDLATAASEDAVQLNLNRLKGK